MSDKKPKSLEEIEEFRRWVREHEHREDPDGKQSPGLLEVAHEINEMRDKRKRRIVISLEEE